MKKFCGFAVAGIVILAIAFAAYTMSVDNSSPNAPDKHVRPKTEIVAQDKPLSTEQTSSSKSSGIDTQAVTQYQADQETYARVVTPFLKTHCLKCHGPETQKSNFRVDRDLLNDFLRRSVIEKWSEVLNMLNADEMPPKGEPRPPAAESRRLAEWIEKERVRAERARVDRTIILRRLNREEYNNTIRDLIGIDFDLVDEFPSEPAAGGFDNNGGALTISPLHLEIYLKTAQKILDRAIVDVDKRPRSIKWRFEFEKDMKRTDHNRIRLDDGRNQRVMMTRYSHRDEDGLVFLKQRGAACRIGYFTVPHPGEYAIRIRAAGVVPSQKVVAEEAPKITGRSSNATHFATDRSYRYGYPRMKLNGYLGSLKRIYLETDVEAPVSAPKTYEVRAWFTPEIAGVTLCNEYRIPYSHINHWARLRKEFPRPALAVDWVEIEGPIYDDWPPSSHKRILIDSPNKGVNEQRYARDVLAYFMERAYRRPLRQGEVKPFLELFQKVQKSKSSFAAAIKVPLTAVLASPHFLYLVEGDDADRKGLGPLNNYELASRLSYFLWSSMPDDTLLDLAKAGKLNDPQTVRAQVDRMLRDKRSDALVKNFAGQWLRLREVGANPPVESLYWRYDKHLESSMRGETEAFFEYILRNDLSVLDFIQSDYITINERLARFYDIPGVKGDHFRPVKVPKDVPRGGLVTQASMLSVTSNGTRTSPVWRGVWILDRLLGDPPPPPPPNAGDIPPADPTLKNATLRQRLQLHRKNTQCARCHDKIDPLGFALENFDAAGEWRERETPSRNNPPPIDASAQFPDGTKFTGFLGLQRELLKRKGQFLRCLSKKLYTYALGRELEYADETMIAGAGEYMENNGRTLRALMHHIVSSQAFRSK